jgi:hypothetical protein
MQGVAQRGMQDKEKMMRMGFSALMAYGLVSHITYASCIIASWVISGTRSGLSPFVRGQVRAQVFAICGPHRKWALMR